MGIALKVKFLKNMCRQLWSLYFLVIFLLGLDSKFVGEAFQPKFVESLMNLTVPAGRDATFRCLVQNLGGYRVGWVKADTKAIQAIHIHVITNNHRVSVSHNGQSIWNLHIKNVQEEDSGQYMCQINTDPMQSQMGYLNVVIPPDFIAEETSGDVMVSEGGTARVSCRASGIPKPRIVWRREDGADIVIRDPSGSKTKVAVYEEEVLNLTKISRLDMGAYLCIATNGVPPSVSKRIQIKVHFHPVIQVPNQLVGAPLGTDVTLECYVESSPRSINYWVRDSNEMVISSSKYDVANRDIGLFESHMSLTVRNLTPSDVGGYRCVAKNSLGEVDSVIRLYEIPAAGRNSDLFYGNFKSSTSMESMEGSDYHHGSLPTNSNEIKPQETATDFSKKSSLTNEIDNTTKNKTLYHTIPNNVVKQKLSNKVNKIFDELDIKLESNNCINKYNKIVIFYILSFNLISFAYLLL